MSKVKETSHLRHNDLADQSHVADAARQYTLPSRSELTENIIRINLLTRDSRLWDLDERYAEI